MTEYWASVIGHDRHGPIVQIKKRNYNTTAFPTLVGVTYSLGRARRVIASLRNPKAFENRIRARRLKAWERYQGFKPYGYKTDEAMLWLCGWDAALKKLEIMGGIF